MNGPSVRHDSLAAAVRYALVARQLDAHLPPAPGPVVDVGSGAGDLGLRLARRGYHVTMVDVSTTALDRVRRVLGDEAGEVAGRVELIRGRAEEAADLLDRGRFGLVCCHALLPLVAEPAAIVEVLAALARPGATVSVAFKNAAGLAMLPGLEGRFEDAADAVDRDVEFAADGRELRGHHLEEVRGLLTAAGIGVRAWFGVGVFTAHRREPPRDGQVGAAVAAEERAGRRDPYRRVARLLHVVGERAR